MTGLMYTIANNYKYCKNDDEIDNMYVKIDEMIFRFEDMEDDDKKTLRQFNDTMHEVTTAMYVNGYNQGYNDM